MPDSLYSKILIKITKVGLLLGPRLMAWTTKSPIWGNHWVPWGCRAHLGSVKRQIKWQIISNLCCLFRMSVLIFFVLFNHFFFNLLFTKLFFFRLWCQRVDLDLCNEWCVKLWPLCQSPRPCPLWKVWPFCVHGLPRTFRFLVRIFNLLLFLKWRVAVWVKEVYVHFLQSGVSCTAVHYCLATWVLKARSLARNQHNYSKNY